MKNRKFERVSNLEDYFMINFENGKAFSNISREEHLVIDDKRFNNNNYFHNAKRAQEVADKINLLLKLERFYDLYCPKYVPNWNDDKEEKWYVFFDNIIGFYDVNSVKWAQDETIVYFPTEEIAQKVCYILNKEREGSENE